MKNVTGKLKAIIFAALVMIAFYVIISFGQMVVMFKDMMKLAAEGITDTNVILTKLSEIDGLMATAQFVGEIFVIAVMLLWYYFGYVKKDKAAGTYVPVTQKFNNIYNVIFVLLVMIAGSCVLYGAFSATQLIIPEQVEETSEMLTGLVDNWFGIIAVVLGAPISEELAVRGIITRRARKSFGLVGCVLISGICFGVLHGNPTQIIYAIPMGMAFGYIAYKFNTVIPTMIGHALHNGLGGMTFAAIGIPGVLIVFVICCAGIVLVYKKVQFPENRFPEDVDAEEAPAAVDADMFVEE